MYLSLISTVLVYYHLFCLNIVFYSWSLLEITVSWVLLWCARKQPSKYWFLKITVISAVYSFHNIQQQLLLRELWENSITSLGTIYICIKLIVVLYLHVTCFSHSLVLGCRNRFLNAWWFLESVPFVYKCSIVCTPPSVSSHPICSMMELFKMELLLVSASCKSLFCACTWLTLFFYIYFISLLDNLKTVLLKIKYCERKVKSAKYEYTNSMIMPSNWIHLFLIN